MPLTLHFTDLALHQHLELRGHTPIRLGAHRYWQWSGHPNHRHDERRWIEKSVGFVDVVGAHTQIVRVHTITNGQRLCGIKPLHHPCGFVLFVPTTGVPRLLHRKITYVARVLAHQIRTGRPNGHLELNVVRSSVRDDVHGHFDEVGMRLEHRNGVMNGCHAV